MDGLRQRLDAGWLLETLGVPALASHRSAGDDGVEGVSGGHQHAGARLPHRCVHRPGRDSAGRVVLLSAQPDEKRRVEGDAFILGIVITSEARNLLLFALRSGSRKSRSLANTTLPQKTKIKNAALTRRSHAA